MYMGPIIVKDMQILQYLFFSYDSFCSQFSSVLKNVSRNAQCSETNFCVLEFYLYDFWFLRYG